jgi:putative endopeptidase
VLIANVKKSFAERMLGLPWMSPETKQEALAKLASMKFKIGYPDRWEDYRSLEIRPDSYVVNALRAGAWDFRYGTLGLEKAGKPVDRSAWFMHPQTVNAYYEPALNEMVFPAAILQPPFFDRTASDAANYGAIGAVIGHELTHGFDDMGRKYDASGNLRDWWSGKDDEEFRKRVQILIDQFNRYEVLPGLFVNGTLTAGENIADLGGLIIAYRAYRLSQGQTTFGHEAERAGDDRQFFTAFARIWRETIREEALRNSVLSDVHAPNRFRVNGTLFNIADFYSVFPEITPEDRLYRPPDSRPAIW